MKKVLYLPYLFLLLCFDSQSFAQKKPTLEQIMSYSFPSNLIASKRSEKLAWVQNKEGVRNVWFAAMKQSEKAFRAKQLTRYAEDDGQAINQLVFTREEKALIYVRGGGPNGRGEIPNPALLPDGALRQIWRVSLDNPSEPDLLTTGNNPTICPSQEIIAFTRGGQIWVYDLRLNIEKPLLKIRGSAGELRWSPDGQKLGFSSFRGDHAFIGIYDLDKKRLQYISPSVDNDGSLVWSPDGTQVAFLRIPNERNQLIFEPHREGLPYSIWVHNFITAKTKKVWQAKPGVGSVFRNISASNQLFWAANNQIVFPYEGDGWTHLYTVSASGGKARLLTLGKFELQFVSMSPDRKEMIYSGNQNDIDRQHIWRVHVSGGQPVQVTRGKGIEWSPVLTPAKHLAYLGSTGVRPAQAQIKLSSKKAKPLIINALGKYPSKKLVVPQPIVFKSADGLKIHAQLFMPKNIRKGKKRPAVLFFHGGSRRQMLLGFHHRGYYHNNYAMNQYLASKGYIVLSVNYRSGIGYGMKFREALNYGATGASEFQDVIAAGRYLQSRPEVDAKKIGLWGGSYGGYLTALGLARASDMFAAGVDMHGVHDWNAIVKNFIPSYNPLARKDFAKLAYDSSPIAFIKTWRSPVLLIHGDDDRNVPFSETVDLAESLRKQKVEFEQLIFPDEVHGLLLHRNWVKAYKAAADFFDRKLQKK
ncbi:MAG TPA: S9 family peptidase [Microscillaceae bacterium]|nr:S9 family peptidase [Microscillaceae bacterium]